MRVGKILALLVATAVGASAQTRTVSIGRVESDDPGQSRVLSETLEFWLRRSRDLKVVPQGGGVVLTGKIVKADSGKVTVLIGSAHGNLLEAATGDPANLAFLTRQLAQRVHFGLTRHWIPEVDKSEKLSSKDTKIVEESDPLSQIAPQKPDSGKPPAIKVQLSLDREPGATYYFGEKMRIRFRADRDCLVTIYNQDSAGNVALLYPNAHTSGKPIKANTDYTLPASNDDWELEVGGVPGMETITLQATISDWDYPGKSRMTARPIDIGAKSLGDFAKSVAVKLRDKESEGYGTASVKFFSMEKKPSP